MLGEQDYGANDVSGFFGEGVFKITSLASFKHQLEKRESKAYIYIMSTQKPGKGQVLGTVKDNNVNSKRGPAMEPVTDERRKLASAFNEKEIGALWYLADRLAEHDAEGIMTPEALVDEALKNWKKGFSQ